MVWHIDEDDDKVSKYKRDKSLGILCQQFIGLFVTWRRIISLEQAARQISKREELGLNFNTTQEHASLEVDDGAGLQDLTLEEAQRLKTKIRRLYDIANVLQSIGLIEKTNHTHNKKPAFRWVGIHGVHAFMQELKDERA